MRGQFSELRIHRFMHGPVHVYVVRRRAVQLPCEIN